MSHRSSFRQASLASPDLLASRRRTTPRRSARSSIALLAATCLAACDAYPPDDTTSPPPPISSARGALVEAPSPEAQPKTVARYVVLDGPSALEAIRGRELSDAARRKHVAARAAALRERHRALRPALEAAGATIVADLVLVANMFQVVVAEDRLPALAKLPGVTALRTPTVLKAALDRAVRHLGTPSIWQGMGSGEGMRIGIIDSGFDYYHAALGGSGDPDDFSADDPTVVEPGTFPTARVIGGVDLVGDAYVPGAVPAPDADPLDCLGHGTAVASAALGGGVRADGSAYAGPWDMSLAPESFSLYPGVAPQASLFAIRVLPCGDASDMLAPALELAADPDGDGDIGDHLEIVNLSLGNPFCETDTDIDRPMLDNLAAAGTLVIAAAGNDGSADFVMGFPACVPSVLAVGASFGGAAQTPFPAFEVTAPASVVGTYPAQATVDPGLDALGVFEGKAVVAAPILACEPLTNAADLVGKVAIVRRGVCSYTIKAQNAADAGAVAVIVVDNTFDDYPSGFGPGRRAAPMLQVRRLEGEALIAASPIDVRLGPDLATVITVGPDAVANLSSSGPNWSGELKPDLVAPGFDIFVAASGTGIEAFYQSGTSLASPLVAGAAALLLQARPTLTARELKALLVGSAQPVENSLGIPYVTTRSGTGRLQVDVGLGATITATLAGDAGQAGVAFGNIVAATERRESRTVEVANLGTEAVTLDLALDSARELPGATVAFTPASLTLAAGARATFELSLTIDPTRFPGGPFVGWNSPASTFVGFGERGGADTANLTIGQVSGRVMLTPREADVAPAAIAYHGSARTAGARSVAGVSGCMGPDGGRATIALEGPAAAHDNATSVLAFGTDVTEADLAPEQAVFDVLATGFANDPEAGVVYFGIALADDWSSPVLGHDNGVFGVYIDLDADDIEDYVVIPVNTSRVIADDTEYVSYPNAPYSLVVDIEAGEANARYLPVNGIQPGYDGPFFGKPAADTQVYYNHVAVLPVAVKDLARDHGTVIRYQAATDFDRSAWVTVDLAATPVRVRDGVAGPSLSLGDAAAIDVDVDGRTPKLWLLHHTNGDAPRFETVDLAGVAALTSDLALSATGGGEIDVGAVGTASFSVTASGARDAVSVSFTASGGTLGTLIPSVGTCEADRCELGPLAAGATVTIDVSGSAASVGELVLTGTVASTPTCESAPANDSASVSFSVDAVVEPEVEAGPEQAEAAEVVTKSGKDSGCGASSGASALWVCAGIALWLGTRRRRA